MTSADPTALTDAPNPFSRPVIDGPRDLPATAESIHRAELTRIVAVFDRLAAQPVPRLKPGPLALLVLSQMPGSGKSHLLGRLWKELNGRATVIFLRAHQDRHAFWRRILERLVQELEYPETTSQRVLQAGDATQLDRLARHLLADLMERGQRTGNVKASVQLGEVLRSGTPQAIRQFRKKLPDLMQHFGGLVSIWMNQLSATGLQLERHPVAWLKVLTSYTLHQADEPQRRLALDWMQGHELGPDEAQLLGLAPSQRGAEPTGGPSEASINESAFQCVKDLCTLSAFFRPVVFAFDQTEVYGQDAELAHAFGATLGRLQAECINQLTVVTGNEHPWLHSVSRHFEQADRDRFDPQIQVVIKGIDQAQARELVTVKMLGAGYLPEQVADFVQQAWLSELFVSRTARPLPRAIEQAACAALERWRNPIDPAPPPPDPSSLDQAFEQHRQRLLATPKALDFDLGVLLWTLGTGLSRVPGLVVSDISHHAKSRLQVRWQSPDRTVFFVLDSSSHWKHWQAVVMDYQLNFRELGMPVAGRVLWHGSLKPVGEGMRKQLEAAVAQGLALRVLSDEEMASLYAAQAMYADVCQGDLPGVDTPSLLDFLGTRLQPFADQMLNFPGTSAPVAPTVQPVPVPLPGPAQDLPAQAPVPAQPPKPPVELHLGALRHHPHAPQHLPLEAMARRSAVLGSTGSGKTTAALRLIEQALAQGIPAVLLDRKGDLCRYAQPEAWVDPLWPPAAHRDDTGRAALHSRLVIRVYTPGSIQGRGLRLPLAPAGLAQLPAPERDLAALESAAAFAAALGLTRVADKPRQAVLVRVFQVLARRIQGRGIVLDDVLALLAGEDPDLLDAIGQLDPRLCTKLAEQVETFRINSGTLMDERAEPLHWENLFNPGPDGRVPLTIISTKFLGDDGSTLFWVAQFFLELLRYVSRHPSDRLQGLLMIDEADLYLPATKVPATKGPLESLLKRARSGGVGLMLCTQSPGDLDYRGRDNIRNWLLGAIRETRALEKLSGLLADSKVNPEQLAKQKVGQFVFAAEGKVHLLDVPPNAVKTQQLSEPDILQVARHAI